MLCGDGCDDAEARRNVFEKVQTYMDYFWALYRDKDTPKLLPALRFFRNNASIMPAPLLMEMYRLYDTEKITADVLNEIIDLLDVYMVRRALVSRDTSEITRFFPGLLRNVIKATGDDYKTLVQNLKYFLVDNTKFTSMKMPTDEDIREYLLNNDAYVLSCTRCVLDKMERVGNSAVVDLDNLTVEHLLPQKGTDFWYRHVSAEDYEHYVGLIGNLTLATGLDNSRMGNDEWNAKKEILSNTNHIKLNADLLSLDVWDADAIKARTDKMIKRIISIYPYFESGLTASPITPEREQRFSSERRGRQCVFKDTQNKGRRFNFDMVQIPVGATLTFAKDTAETCCVASINTVLYKGEEYSLSRLAIHLLSKMGIEMQSIQGPAVFMYEGELLTDRRKRLENA